MFLDFVLHISLCVFCFHAECHCLLWAKGSAISLCLQVAILVERGADGSTILTLAVGHCQSAQSWCSGLWQAAYLEAI